MIDLTPDSQAILDHTLSPRTLKRRVVGYREFAGTLRHYAGPAKGQIYDPDSDPMQRYLIEQFDSGFWKRIFVNAPPQHGGKTIVGILVPALRNAISARLPVGYGLPTLADLDKAWAEKLKPALEGSGYGDHLPKSGPGARGGRGHTLEFHDPVTKEREGMLVFLAGGGYGSTVSAALIDEIDQFRTADGAPLWGAIDDIFSRANAYGPRALRVGVGTVEHDEQPVILVLVFEQGTGTVPWPRCPHCGAWVNTCWQTHVKADWSSLESAADTVRIVCPENGCLWTETDRQIAIRSMRFPHKGQIVDARGEIVGAPPRTDTLGLWWESIHSPHSNLVELASDYYRAKARLAASGGVDHGLMRKFRRYRECKTYTADKNDEGLPLRLTRGYLVARSAASTYAIATHKREEAGDSLHVANLPTQGEHPAFLIPTIDVQRGGRDAPGRLYIIMRGWDHALRSWDLAWGHVVAAPIGRWPTAEELHRALTRADQLVNGLAIEYGLPIVRRGVDVGDRPDDLLPWIMGHRDWRAIKGADTRLQVKEREDIPDVIYRREQTYEGRRYNLWQVSVSAVRKDFQGAYLVPPGRPSAAHVPQGLAVLDTLVSHYCATAEIPDGKGGTRWSTDAKDRKHHDEWQRRRDLLDCGVYGRALAIEYLKQQERVGSAPAAPDDHKTADDFGAALW